MPRILVIDDDVHVREILKQFFEMAGYEVLIAENGKEALRIHRSTPGDLIITDIFMPEKEGLETIMEFRRNYPLLKIIAISGGGNIGGKEYLKTAKALGAQKTFSKPLDFQELLRTVGEILSAGQCE